jgi:hypothetical protein
VQLLYLEFANLLWENSLSPGQKYGILGITDRLIYP